MTDIKEFEKWFDNYKEAYLKYVVFTPQMETMLRACAFSVWCFKEEEAAQGIAKTNTQLPQGGSPAGSPKPCACETMTKTARVNGVDMFYCSECGYAGPWRKRRTASPC